MTSELPGETENFYTLVPEQGMCLIGDTILNLKRISLIRREDGRTNVYMSGAREPVILPEDAFEQIREAVFSVDDMDDEDMDDEDEEL